MEEAPGMETAPLRWPFEKGELRCKAAGSAHVAGGNLEASPRRAVGSGARGTSLGAFLPNQRISNWFNLTKLEPFWQLFSISVQKKLTRSPPVFLQGRTPI